MNRRAETCVVWVRLAVGGIAAALAVSLPAYAQLIVPVEQSRQVGAWVSGNACGPEGESRSVNAGDFGPFEASAEAIFACDQAASSALANQRSLIGLSQITATGDGGVAVSAVVPVGMGAFATSNLRVAFELTRPSAFTLEGNVAGSTTGVLAAMLAESSVALVNLEGAGVVGFGGPGFDGTPFSIDFAESGVLEPGRYEIRAFAGGLSDLSPNGSADASFDFTLGFTLVCPADLDGDGSIGLSDLAILLSNLGTAAGADPLDGDLDGDGDVDLSDLANLLAVFGSDCD